MPYLKSGESSSILSKYLFIKVSFIAKTNKQIENYIYEKEKNSDNYVRYSLLVVL